MVRLGYGGLANTGAGSGAFGASYADMAVLVQLSNLSADSDEECGVSFRKTDASNFLCAYVDDGDNLLHLSRFDAGAETSIATAAWTPANTAEILVIAQQDRIRVWLDYVLRIDATCSSFLTAATAGLFSRSTTAVKFGPFYAQMLSEVA